MSVCPHQRKRLSGSSRQQFFQGRSLTVLYQNNHYLHPCSPFSLLPSSSSYSFYSSSSSISSSSSFSCPSSSSSSSTSSSCFSSSHGGYRVAVPNLFSCCTPKLKFYLCGYPIRETYHKLFQ